MYQKLEKLLICKDRNDAECEILKFYADGFQKELLFTQLDLFHVNYTVEENGGIHAVCGMVQHISAA